MSSPLAASGGPAATDAGARPPGRGRRAGAVLIDFVTAALAVMLAALLATLWLLARTAWGRDDPGTGDALVATAFVLATTPAWAAWQAARVRRGTGTLGQGVLSLTATVPPSRGLTTAHAALLRLTAHPLAITAWLWLATVALLLDARPVAIACLVGAGAWALGGITSAVLVLRDPSARALHDRLAGTSLSRR